MRFKRKRTCSSLAVIAARPGRRTGGSYQVMVMTTAAAAATRMAIAAVSTVMEVASVVSGGP